MGELSPEPTLSPETCAQAACVCAPFGLFARWEQGLAKVLVCCSDWGRFGSDELALVPLCPCRCHGLVRLSEQLVP